MQMLRIRFLFFSEKFLHLLKNSDLVQCYKCSNVKRTPVDFRPVLIFILSVYQTIYLKIKTI